MSNIYNGSYVSATLEYPATAEITSSPQSDNGSSAPYFTVTLLVLLGVVILTAIIYSIYHMPHCCRRTSPPPLTSFERHQRDIPRRGSSSFFDVERGSSGESLATATSIHEISPRTDSMVHRASAWARYILSGHHIARQSSGKDATAVSIPVKCAIVVMQPDGDASLGYATEPQQKDCAVQVSDANFSNFGTTPRRQQHPRQPTRQRVAVEADGEGEIGGEGLTRLHSSPRRSVRTNDQQRGDAIVTQDSSTSLSEDIDVAESGGIGAVAVQTEEQEAERRRRRRRQRQRRGTVGTCEASCQTE